MRRLIVVLLVPLTLGGCLSYTAPPQPAHTTVVVPNGSAVACPNGAAPPC